jgi:hypothetical protein
VQKVKVSKVEMEKVLGGEEEGRRRSIQERKGA